MVSRIVRLAVVCTAAMGLAVLNAFPANAATSSVWNMDEPPGATTMVGSPGPSGTIGNLVTTGVATDTSRGYSFPGGNPIIPQPMPGKLVTVPNSAAVFPGGGPYSIGLRFKTSNTNNGNMVQKGVTGDVGGMLKVELHDGRINCTWLDNTWTSVNPPPSSHLNLTEPAPVNQWTTVTCARLRANTATGWKTTLTVNGTTTFQNRAVGTINNDWPISIGGKSYCTTSPQHQCDYYEGLMDWVQITTG
jgi:hypothetical protein